MHISGARSLAMSVVALALGWVFSLRDASTLAHYKALSHDALMSELASEYDSSLSSNIVGAVSLVLVGVIAVDLLTQIFERVWARLRGPAAPASGGSPS